MPVNQSALGSSAHYALHISQEWGVLPETFVSAPQTSVLTDKPVRSVRAEMRLSLNSAGELAVLADQSASRMHNSVPLFYFSVSGQLKGQTRLPAAAGSDWHIQDFMVDPSGSIYLLETVGSATSLRKLSPSGQVLWARTGQRASDFNLERLDGQFQQILIDDQSNIYVSVRTQDGFVARVNPDDGRLQPFATWPQWNGEVFMDGKARIYFVRYLPETRKRAWTVYDPQTKQETQAVCDDQLYGLLGSARAADNQGRGYALSGRGMACFSVDCELVWREQVDNIVVDELAGTLDMSVYDSNNAAQEVQIRSVILNGDSEGETRLSIPTQYDATERQNWQLVYLDFDQSYVIYGGETHTKDGSLLTFSRDGTLRNAQSPAPDIQRLAFHLQMPQSWAVDLEGNLYLPLLGPQKFYVLKVSH